MTSDITAPIPGTFYRRESPDAAPFIEEGSTVAVGDTVGLIEMMKMFKAVKSDVAGTVAEILVEDVGEVDAGDPLVRVEE